MSVQTKLKNRFQKIRRNLSSKEKYMFRALNGYVNTLQEDVEETLSRLLAKKKYASVYDNQSDMLVSRKLARSISQDVSMQKIRNILKQYESKITAYIKQEYKKVYKDDVWAIGASIEEITPFTAKVTFTEKELNSVENIYVGGFPIAYYTRKALNGLYDKIERSLKRNIIGRKNAPQVAVMREIGNGFNELRSQLHVVMFNFNSTASNQAFYQAIIGFKYINKVK